ncbi:MAG: ABC transporter permease [Deltaproteobacteria bacterium]|nr:ABC transporter permease [Deltaproteobacteria bacterium]
MTQVSRTSLPPEERGGWFERRVTNIAAGFGHAGGVTLLALRSLRTLFRTRLEVGAVIYQMEQLGVQSMGIAAATAIFVGMVMTIQFAFAMEQFGAIGNIGRVIVLSEARELAPSLTSLVVGSRIAAGMAAEIGSMVVTEQVDAIRALGADPIKKLVIPRILAAVITMPMICALAFLLGTISAMFVAAVSYNIQPEFFISTALGSVTLRDFGSGLAKTPFFGFLVALLGCYFGLETRGGTEGVGRSTTRSVVVVSIGVLIADALLTQIFLSL